MVVGLCVIDDMHYEICLGVMSQNHDTETIESTTQKQKNNKNKESIEIVELECHPKPLCCFTYLLMLHFNC